jgi:RimK family alpha-L-glutamate ligase
MIAIITDDPGWHGQQLKNNLITKGFRAEFVRLQDCHFEITDSDATIHLPGFDHLPDAVFVRGVPGGSLEEVVYYLDVLHGLEALGITVMNNVQCIERSVDKGMTSFLLKKHGLSTPNTIYSSNLHYIYKRLREGINEGKEFVLKPVFGSQGKGLQRVSSHQQLIDTSEMHGVVYLQEFIDAGFDVGVDFRVFVVGDQVISSMKRTGESWITNVAQGGKVEPVVLNKSILKLALDAARVLNMDYAGVDLMQDKQGQFWITEINSVPAWKGLQATTEKKIVDAIADHFISHSGLKRPNDSLSGQL